MGGRILTQFRFGLRKKSFCWELLFSFWLRRSLFLVMHRLQHGVWSPCPKLLSGELPLTGKIQEAENGGNAL